MYKFMLGKRALGKQTLGNSGMQNGMQRPNSCVTKNRRRLYTDVGVKVGSEDELVIHYDVNVNILAAAHASNTCGN